MLRIKIHQFYVKKELLRLLRVYRKSATRALTDGRIAKDEPLYTGYILSHFQKSATFRFDKSAKNIKNNGSKNEKNIFSLLNLSQKTLKKLLIKLNHLFMPLVMSQKFPEISLTIYVNAA